MASGKGGVGKSHLAANVASVAAKRGLRTLLLDCSVSLSSLDVLFGVTVGLHVGDLLDGAPLEDVLTETAEGPWLLPASPGERRLSQLTASDRRTLLACWSRLSAQFDVLIIDSASGIADDTLFFAGLAQQVVLVVNGEPTSLNDAVVTAQGLRAKTAVRRVEVVVNPARSERSAAIVYGRFEDTLGVSAGMTLRYAGHVPEDHNLRRAAAMRKPLVNVAPLSPASRAFARLTDHLLATPVAAASGVNLEGDSPILELAPT